MVATLLTGMVVGGLKKEKKVMVTGAVVVLSMVSLLNLKPQMQVPENLLGINEEWLQAEDRWVDVEELFLPATAVAATASAEVVVFSEGEGEVAVKEVKSHMVEIEVGAEMAGVVQVNRNDFPGWGAWVDGKKVEVGRSARGLVELSVPGGKHEVLLRFEETTVRWWANGVSVLAGLGLVWWIIVVRQE